MSKNGDQIDTMYSDFKKAFDKVPHRRLISKLHSHDIDDTIGSISDFLNARKYRENKGESKLFWMDWC